MPVIKCPCGWKLPVDVSIEAYFEDEPEACVTFRCPDCGQKFGGTKAVLEAVDGRKVSGTT